MSIPFKIISEESPVIKFDPASTVSGLSVVSLIVMFGKPSIAHSSWTVPLSVITHKLFFSNFINSKKSKGSISLRPFGIESLFFFILIFDRG